MSLVETLNAARKDRLQRIADRAYLPSSSRPAPAVKPVPPPFFLNPPRRFDAFEEYAWRVEIEGIIQQEYRQPTLHDIRSVVCMHYGIQIADLISARRTQDLTRPRHVAYYLSAKLTLKSLPEIGMRLGGKDHTTVLHGARKIERLLLTDSALRETVSELKKMLGAHDISDQRTVQIKLDEDEVRAIRASRLSNPELAKKYDVSSCTISAIKAWRTWKHVQ